MCGAELECEGAWGDVPYFYDGACRVVAWPVAPAPCSQVFAVARES